MNEDKEIQNSKENQAFVERIKINVEESSKIWEDLKATRNKNKIKNKKYEKALKNHKNDIQWKGKKEEMIKGEDKI